MLGRIEYRISSFLSQLMSSRTPVASQSTCLLVEEGAVLGCETLRKNMYNSIASHN